MTNYRTHSEGTRGRGDEGTYEPLTEALHQDLQIVPKRHLHAQASTDMSCFQHRDLGGNERTAMVD